MQIFLVRHGQSTGNIKKGYISGQTDECPLTHAGVSQVVAAAGKLKEVGIQKIYSSPVVRARQSAEIISNTLGIPIAFDAKLSELNYGVFEQSYWISIASKEHREQYAKVWENIDVEFPGGGESLKKVFTRVYAAFEQIKAKKQPSLIISHDMVVGICAFIASNPACTPDTVKEYEKELIAFVNSFRAKNGQIIEIDVEDKIVHKLTRLPSVVISEEKVSEYLCGVIGANTYTVAEVPSLVSGNHVYQAHAKGGETYIVKFTRDSRAGYVERLSRLYLFLHEAVSCPTPQIIHFDVSGLSFIESVLIQKYLYGQGQDAVIKSRGWATQKEIFKDILQGIQEIHNLDIKTVEPFWHSSTWDGATDESYTQFMLAEIAKTVAYLKKLPTVSKEDTKYVVKKLLEVAEWTYESRHVKAPIHGDFACNNIIINADLPKHILVSIIDFEKARIGDPMWDLAYYSGFLALDAGARAESFWDELVLKTELVSKTAKRIRIYNRYKLLFHTWTMRDSAENPSNKELYRRAQVSAKWVDKWLASEKTK